METGDERRKLLVLDVNGLLLSRQYRPDSLPRSVLSAPHTRCGRFDIYLRPHVVDFLRWCQDRFVLVIWGTAYRKNIKALLPLLFPATDSLPLILGQEDCLDEGSEHPTIPGKRVLSKPLSAIGEAGGETQRFDSRHTLVIDDSPYKCGKNPPNTSIHPRPWKPGSDTDTFLAEGGYLRTLLASVHAASDVGAVVRTLATDEEGFLKDDGQGDPEVRGSRDKSR